MDLALHDVKVPATEDFLKDIKKLWNTIYQRESRQDIEDKTQAIPQESNQRSSSCDLIEFKPTWLFCHGCRAMKTFDKCI